MNIDENRTLTVGGPRLEGSDYCALCWRCILLSPLRDEEARSHPENEERERDRKKELKNAKESTSFFATASLNNQLVVQVKRLKGFSVFVIVAVLMLLFSFVT